MWRLSLDWRWLRRSRVRLRRVVVNTLPRAVPWGERAAGDNYPVLLSVR